MSAVHQRVHAPCGPQLQFASGHVVVESQTVYALGFHLQDTGLQFGESAPGSQVSPGSAMPLPHGLISLSSMVPHTLTPTRLTHFKPAALPVQSAEVVQVIAQALELSVSVMHRPAGPIAVAHSLSDLHHCVQPPCGPQAQFASRQVVAAVHAPYKLCRSLHRIGTDSVFSIVADARYAARLSPSAHAKSPPLSRHW